MPSHLKINLGKLIEYSPAKVLPTKPFSSEKIRPVCFSAKKQLIGLVYDMSALENNPFTIPEIQTLLDGITVGGHKLHNQEQVLNIAASWKHLITDVLKGKFTINKAYFCKIHKIVARNEALTWGVFRDSQVSISGTSYTPPKHTELDYLFKQLVQDIFLVKNTVQQALLFFLAGSRAQFFFDGNKRTSRLMMNGILLSNGLEAILIPDKKHLEFNQKMIVFYDTGDATDMMNFLIECQPELIENPKNTETLVNEVRGLIL